MTMVDRVAGALGTAGFAGVGQLLVVGVSGGPDSLTLLYVLHSLSDSAGFSLHVAHLDHQLRPESRQDAEFVRGVATDLGVPSTVSTADVGTLARDRGMGVEEAARHARYALFARVAGETGAWGVALGHTADDQVETILLALVRGAGPPGLRGMRALSTRRVEGEPRPLRVIRPLLEVTRTEVEAYLRERGAEPRRDSTNAEVSFRRNRIRHELLPAVRAINPRVGEAILRLGRLAHADEAFFARQVDELWAVVSVRDADTVRLRRRDLAAQPTSLSSRLIRRAFVELVGDARELEAVHVEAALALLSSGRAGGALDWPRGVSVRLSYETLELGRAASEPCLEKLPREGIELAVPGVTALPTGARIVARLTCAACRWEDTGQAHADLDADVAGPGLIVRRRRPGDRIVPLGMRGEKKVQDLLVDAKVPRAERDRVPIVEGDSGIVWVAGVRADDRFRVGPGTREVLCLRVVRGGEPDSPQR